VNTHDERPAGTGGHRADRQQRTNVPTMERGTQGVPGARGHNNKEDTDYSDMIVDQRAERFHEELGGNTTRFGWTLGADLGLLILRLCLGADLLIRGAHTLFGVLGGPGPEDFARILAAMGYQQSSTLSLVTGGTQMASGALLVLGLFTPLAAAGALALMANLVFLNLHGGFFAPDGIEFPVAVGVIALVLMFAGPGRVALDYRRPWFRHPLTTGFISLVISAAAAAGVIVALHH
jgi:putative oxidoreductase